MSKKKVIPVDPLDIIEEFMDCGYLTKEELYRGVSATLCIKKSNAIEIVNDFLKNEGIDLDED